MFKIDPTQNRISPLQAKRFSELGFTERKHLQEWLEHYPQALAQGEGEELLIIQKEFDGFDAVTNRAYDPAGAGHENPARGHQSAAQAGDFCVTYPA